MDYETLISRFVGATREFCDWVEGTAGSDEVFHAMRLVSRLQADVIMLPGVGDDYVSTDDDIPKLLFADKQAARARFSTFPFQYYWVIFTPIAEQPEEPVCGDIADDLSDIYNDLKPGLMAYDLGRHPAAVWHWRFTWGFHWGHHATSALSALYSYQKNR